MDANAYELKRILNLERRYVIPTFQRDYEWTLKDQWALLFDDLENTAARLGRAREEARINGEPATSADGRVSPHFLGAIVLERVPSPAGSLDVRAVVDGQQRLTTIQLMLRGMTDALMEFESPRVPQLRRLLQNPDDVTGGDDEQRYKLWPRRRDRDVWRVVMSDEHTDGLHKYEEARNYFRQRTSQAIGDDSLDQASLLVDTMMDLFKLVVIDLGENDDAQVIFEVLNGRATQLSAADLVKNLLFLRAEVASEADMERLYEETWSQFDDPWWKEEVGRGHAARMHSDMLLTAWITTRVGEEVSHNNVYGEIRSFVSTHEPKIPELLGEIKRYAHEYRVIQDEVPEPDARLRVAYQRIAPLAGTTALPLLLWLRTLPSARLSSESHLKAVIAVESFVIRRAAARYQTRGYGQVFQQVLSKAQRASEDPVVDVGDAVVEALASAPDSREWPSDETMLDVFQNGRFYGVMSAQRLRTLLGAIDARMQERNPYSERAEVDYEGLQVEHVMPQSWEEHWPIDTQDPAEREVMSERRRKAVDRIGNLTLVTQPLNPSGELSNQEWSRKRDALRQHSALRLNAEIVGHDVWNEEMIQARGATLFETFKDIWPGPPPSVSSGGGGETSEGAPAEVRELLDRFAPLDRKPLMERFVDTVAMWPGVKVWAGKSENEERRRIFFSRRFSQLGAFVWIHPSLANVRPRLQREEAPSGVDGIELLDTSRPYQVRVALASEESLQTALVLAQAAYDQAI